VANQELLLEGIESEEKGIAFCQSLLGGVWKQTSYNGNIRKNYAGIGYLYDSQRDAFIAPQPYPSWTLVEETCRWLSPVAYPTDGKLYYWNESTLTCIEAVTS
jgi:hypothetical protein